VEFEQLAGKRRLVAVKAVVVSWHTAEWKHFKQQWK